ncbi:MAG: hypothetical protein OXB95_07580, partial [Rhodobacteraceae bacterium]|nr:hypothetical protein [Paracoccaceae bacterium]
AEPADAPVPLGLTFPFPRVGFIANSFGAEWAELRIDAEPRPHWTTALGGSYAFAAPAFPSLPCCGSLRQGGAKRRQGGVVAPDRHRSLSREIQLDAAVAKR